MERLQEEEEDVVPHKVGRHVVDNPRVDGLHYRRNPRAEDVKFGEALKVHDEKLDEQEHDIRRPLGHVAEPLPALVEAVVEHVVDLVRLQEQAHHAEVRVLDDNRDVPVYIRTQPIHDVPEESLPCHRLVLSCHLAVLLILLVVVVVRIVFLGHHLASYDLRGEVLQHHLVHAEARALQKQLDRSNRNADIFELHGPELQNLGLTQRIQFLLLPLILLAVIVFVFLLLLRHALRGGKLPLGHALRGRAQVRHAHIARCD
mmetsp:Transcript_71142/g.231040  ORF Transcript_71142/g.231040 Transcript_71142/m.231040 type:complete len:259 (-) Transcript_71142:5904-6680(-)